MFFELLWFFLSAGIANMTPVFAMRLFGPGKPIDQGKKYKGKRLLGKGKTWQGLISGTIVGGLFFLVQRQIPVWSLLDYPWYLGFVLGFGALLGDIIASFFKRRRGVPSGKPWIPFDQIDYIVGGLFFVSFVIPLTGREALIILGSYFVLHILANILGYFTGLRKSWI